MNSSLHPKISLIMAFFDRQVMKNNSINLFREKNMPVREGEPEGIDWRQPRPVNRGMQIYCNLLNSNVRMCKFTSCTYYQMCHSKA
ncbi:MAG: hypothetical protein KKI06_13180 [Euryarchaeota archaeon]|nr:hypothetical protein [Euryarchaeota archaeon]